MAKHLNQIIFGKRKRKFEWKVVGKKLLNVDWAKKKRNLKNHGNY